MTGSCIEACSPRALARALHHVGSSLCAQLTHLQQGRLIGNIGYNGQNGVIKGPLERLAEEEAVADVIDVLNADVANVPAHT